MAKKFTLPRGTSDVLTSDVHAWQHIESSARELLSIYNYKEMRTPIFEEAALFKRSLGETTDVVNKQLLELVSSKEDGFALRPEGTASIVRSYVENHLHKKEALSKLFYLGPMFRGERPQKGRLRQFHQIGVEALGVGTAAPYLDVEVIVLSVRLLHAFGLKNFFLKLNTLGTQEDKANLATQLRDAFQWRRSQLCEDCQNRFERNVFRVLDCKHRGCQDIVKKLEIGRDYLAKESLQYFGEVKAAIKGLGVDFQEEPNLVRGLDYYTHTVFEISDSSLGSQDALGAGGRYNNLVSQLGGPDVDGIGFALGIERLLLAGAAASADVARMDVFIVAMGASAVEKGFALLNDLRDQGVSSDMTYRASSMKSQMRQANKSGACYVMILGEDEIKNNEVTLKDMESGEQERIGFGDVVGSIIKKVGV